MAKNGFEPKRLNVGILIFNDVEVLDFCGPFEVFSTTRLNEETRREDESPFHVFLVAENSELIITSGKMKVLADFGFSHCPKLDILVVPGGWGTRTQMKNKKTLDWIREKSSEVEILSSVCTGSMLLGFAGLLDQRSATTHWKSLEWMKESFPNVNVEYDQHVVEDGNIYTSAGISAGIDLSLKITARYFGEDIAKMTAKHMEYPYPENNTRRI